MNSYKDRSALYALVLFLVWPLLAVASAFRNYKEPWAKNIFWAFCAFYGFVFAIGAESQSSDIVRYVTEFQVLHGKQLTLAGIVEYFKSSGEIDVLRTTIAVIMSRFTDSQPILTMVYGVIFGFFFSRNLWFIMERLKGKLVPVTLLLLTCFFLVNPIWEINGFRMWTAAHIFIYGLLPYLFDGKKSGLWISAMSILVHFSFIIPVGLLLAYGLAGNRLTLYFCFFLLTFFISEIDIEAFNNLVESYAPEVLQERTASYRAEGQVEKFREGAEASSRNWYVNWYRRTLSWSLTGFLVVLYVKGRDFFRVNPGWLNLFSFTLLFFGAINLVSSLPSGGRFYKVVYLCALALVILYVQNQPREKAMKRFILVATPGLLLFVIVSVRIALYSLSSAAIMGNPVIALFLMGEYISLNDVMRMLL